VTGGVKVRRRVGPRRVSVEHDGFTLVELMVSLSGGLFVAIAVFMLAKQSTNLYQSEGRAGNATLGSLVGFERLRQEIGRAGFLSSPSARTDPKVCCSPVGDANWPAYLSHLQSVLIQQPTNASVIPPVLAKNGSLPDEITLAGSYASDEVFFVQTVDRAGGGDTIYLQSNQGGLPKLQYQSFAGNAAQQRQLLLSVFGIGRGIRIVDKSNGRSIFGTIADVQGGGSPAIFVKGGAGGPPLVHRETSPCGCGIAGDSAGSIVNVVNIIHYALRDMHTNPAFAPLFNTSTQVSGNTLAVGPAQDNLRRAELVREELDTTGTAIDGTQEIVSEFAVDLKFGITVGHVIPGTTQIAKLETFAPGNESVGSWAGDTTTVVGPAASDPPTTPTPQLVRAVRIRLGVRSREADRQTALDGGGLLAIAPGMYRIGTNPAGGGPFARVRTMQADIALRNQQGAPFL